MTTPVIDPNQHEGFFAAIGRIVRTNYKVVVIVVCLVLFALATMGVVLDAIRDRRSAKKQHDTRSDDDARPLP